MRIVPLIFILAVSLLSCTGSQTGGRQDEGDTLVFSYAQLITVEQRQGYRLVTVKNPWKPGHVLHRYQLVPHAEAGQAQQAAVVPVEGATLVRVPLRRSVVFTSVHAALIAQLQAESQVAGVADLKYMKVPYVQQGVAQGTIVDCGDGMSPLIEKIIDAQADAILLSPFENSGGYGRLEEIDIPLIECAEYMEQSPLARAEWMRFYGILYGKEREADSLFAVVDSSYRHHCERARHIVDGQNRGRRVLMDKQTGSVWYVPGGRSTIGRMLQDAHCDYPFAGDSHSGSLALPFEAILEKCGEADVWLLRYDSNTPLTLSQLLKEQPGYKQLRPVQTGQVYGCNVMTSMFYEESPFRPDLLLQDFIHILYPSVSGQAPLRYYHQLK